MSNKGKNKNKNKNKGGKGPQETQIKAVIDESEELQNDSIPTDPIPSQIKPERQETSTTHDERSNNDLSCNEESSFKNEEHPPQAENPKVEVAAESKEPETSEIPLKTEEAPQAQSQTETTVDQGQAKQEEEPRRVYEEAPQQVDAKVESSEIKEIQSSEIKIEQPHRQPETEQALQGHRDTTEFEIISSGDFTNVTHLQDQPVANEVKYQPVHHQEHTEHRELHTQVAQHKEVVPEIYQEPSPILTTEILVQHKQNPHVEQPALEHQADEAVPKNEDEPRIEVVVEQIVEKQEEVQQKNEVNHEVEPIREHARESIPEVGQMVPRQSVQHAHHQDQSHHASAPQPVHQKHEEVHLQNEKKHEQPENQQPGPVVERHYETVIQYQNQHQKVEIRQEHHERIETYQQQVPVTESQEVIDLNKPVDQDEPVVKKKAEQRVFRLVESNEISINESNEIQVEKSLQVNKSDEIKVPVQSSLSFSDLNYSVEINASQDYDRISNPIRHVDHVEQPVNAEPPLSKDDPLIYTDPAPQVAVQSQAIQVGQPVVVLQECIANSSIPEQMFYSIVPETSVAEVIEEKPVVVAPPVIVEVVQPVEVVVLPVEVVLQPIVEVVVQPIVEVAVQPIVEVVVQPIVEVAAEPKIDERKEDVHIKIEVEKNVQPVVQIEKVEVQVPVRPVEVVQVHQAAPEVVVQHVQDRAEPVSMAAQPQPSVEEESGESYPVSELLRKSRSQILGQVEPIQQPKKQKPKRSALSKIAISTLIGGSIIGGGFFLLPNKKPISLIAAGVVSMATFFFA